ncbi:hypothetical protein M3P05_06685 [Sansalvadorimonas sp. 2012CJ34-2]|uniref:ABC transmembrane type-1 domain-containing protein n=1 Tax=Parendozoicomonas callyspongiae TaxID=2942213 RepID=A0ABT0PEJ1_9GAMM|nr:hypothetical protein [Sansalvadorimonas sp. 2012CJ34-2]MCL6269626.1 hypothetical protein [Sansalvadorimonas sp. 2012CJ34-2]
MEFFFSQGAYDEAMGMLYVLLLLIGTLKLWSKGRLLSLYILASFIWLPPLADTSWELVWRFLSEDIVPAPIKYGGNLLNWLNTLLLGQVIPGVSNTVLLTQISLALTAVLTLVLFPVRTKLFCGRGRVFGHGLLVVLRTTPEYLMAFLGVLFLGPSMLPGVLALGIHNAGILAHLTGRFADEQEPREDAPKGILLYFYEVLPRVYRQFLAFLLYRWEVIQRESAILGILGIPTLGFFIDSAFEELRLDRAMFLILVTALMNMTVDGLARVFRRGKITGGCIT